jgi:heat shock protein HtpX
VRRCGTNFAQILIRFGQAYRGWRNIVGWLRVTDNVSTANWAVGCPTEWHSSSAANVLRDLQALSAGVSNTKSGDLRESCSAWIGTHLPVNVRRQLHHALNEKCTGQLTAGLVLLLALCGWLNGGEDGARRAVIGGVSSIGPVPPSSDIMRARFNAYRLLPEEAPHLGVVVETICRRADIGRVPEIYVLPGVHTMNAYALGGRDGAVITLTEGLLRGMTQDEVAAILAHEIAHIAYDDGSTMILAGSLQRAIGYAAWWGQRGTSMPLQHGSVASWVLSNAPAIGELLCLALSRIREYAADALALELIAEPRVLASALEKLERHHRWANGLAMEACETPDLSYLHSHPSTAQRISFVRSLS